jgi:hypothetical protein
MVKEELKLAPLIDQRACASSSISRKITSL